MVSAFGGLWRVGANAQTAQIVGEQLMDIPLRRAEAAGDYIPYLPGKDELPAEFAADMIGRLDRAPSHERDRGPALARQAIDTFTGAVNGASPRHDLVITHNFLIAWLVRAALDSPSWRWLGLNYCNAALTVIRYPPDRPSSILVYNDMTHLPDELRWTDFPANLRI